MKQMQHFRGSVEAFHVKSVDTTGAGDSFVGALLAKIVDDQSILEVSTIIILKKTINIMDLIHMHVSARKKKNIMNYLIYVIE